MQRKIGKLKALGQGAKKDAERHQDISKRMFLFSFPYLAYASFHPTNKEAEAELETAASAYLQVLNVQPDAFSALRRLREHLHDINIPVNGNNLLASYRVIERDWIDTWTNWTVGNRVYWQIFRNVAERQ